MADGASALAAAPNETLYIQNLNERVKLPIMKQSLEALFSTFGPVLSIVAHKNLRMRGQAFVSFQDKDTATRAMKEVSGFPLYGKSMRVSYARTPSDSVVAHHGGAPGTSEAEQALEAHKAARLAQKPLTRRRNIHRQRALQRKKEQEQAIARGDVPAPAPRRTAPARAQANQLPDEYVPPNRILFLQQMPSTVTRDQLLGIFGSMPNLYEVRTIPGRTDIAFVEFHDIPSSVAAREATNGYTFPTGEHLKVSFARA
ncbi:Similar to S.cerevisiae protein MSL1 (U2B component of U2 snRNP) [Malassezia sympodialis ATCC 42132]|uniref:Similar to S.cerevisiae protein MSL1 (U2B component of U2 snRNP) n=1 Tax=Malassezia sympodialis (strain ATCC 42132) TaxID=1230383 RepID=A0A1M8A0W1_MALS4|nr:Similar to S.cerevisiae protein MSL1 (U2B component of U2 snRNP) [Malassezia sympodialis ATCC 42132]